MTNNYDPTKVIDLAYLNGLSKGNPRFVKEMIDIFLTDNLEEIQNIEKSIHAKNYMNIKDMAHKMRSTVAFVGLDRLIENEIQIIEQLAVDGADIKRIESLFSKVKKVCEQAAKELKPELGTSEN